MPRSFFVRLSSFELKRNILENAHNLKNFYDIGSTLKVFITHDLTRRQQVENKLLRQMFRVAKLTEKKFSFDGVNFSLHRVIRAELTDF